ncbi:hypothetical protein FRB99_005738 [Tulasnella sp. 403]|nr:hypothetical protein FRB99_005738 [Tulasnella sp. 403]
MPSSKRDYKSLARSLINQRLTIDAYSLHLVHVIGIGAFGVIFLADEYDGCVNTSRQFAVKCLLHSQKPSSDKFIVREKTLHPRIRHPHVVNVHAVIEQMDLVYIVMDYYPEGDLFKAIVDRQEYVGQDDKVRDAFLQVATGLRACHAQGVFHRDIKPENILVRSGYPGSYPKLALADFGLSTNDEYSTEFGVGSSYYMSLECGGGVDRHGIRQTAYSSRNNDVWSLGVLLINFACGRNPWVRAHPTEDTFAAFTRDPNYLLSILPISSELNDLLKAIFDLDPFNRIGLDDVIDRVKRIDRRLRLRVIAVDARGWSDDPGELCLSSAASAVLAQLYLE